MADLVPYLLSGLAIAVTVAKPLGRFAWGMWQGWRAASVTDTRVTVVPSAPTATSPLEQRLDVLERARAKDDAERDAKIQKAAQSAAADSLLALVEAAKRKRKARTQETDAGERRTTDPPSDPQ